MLEWLHSPVVYRESQGFAAQLRELLPVFYSQQASVYHYRHMAERNCREYMRGEVVWLKKYLYVLRPLLAVRWIERDRGFVPIEFERLLITLEGSSELMADIRRLVERKVAGLELDRGTAITSISCFINEELKRLADFTPPESPRGGDLTPLNVLFREMLYRAWSDA